MTQNIAPVGAPSKRANIAGVLTTNKTATMSSREIAEITGSTHDNVLKTVRALIKRGVVSGNETPYIHPQNGQTYTEFQFDYRNTMVVTSGYSPELRAKIIDRWMELELLGRNSRVRRKRVPPFDVTFRRCLNVAAMLPDVDRNQQTLMAARGTKELCGINPLELMGAHALPAPDQVNYETPSELGVRLGLSGRAVNQLLLKARLHEHTPKSATGSDWTMTLKGKDYGRMFDTTRVNAKGSQQQLKWKPETVDLIRPFMDPLEATS